MKLSMKKIGGKFQEKSRRLLEILMMFPHYSHWIITDHRDPYTRLLLVCVMSINPNQEKQDDSSKMKEDIFLEHVIVQQ